MPPQEMSPLKAMALPTPVHTAAKSTLTNMFEIINLLDAIASANPVLLKRAMNNEEAATFTKVKIENLLPILKNENTSKGMLITKYPIDWTVVGATFTPAVFKTKAIFWVNPETPPVTRVNWTIPTFSKASALAGVVKHVNPNAKMNAATNAKITPTKLCTMFLRIMWS